MVVRTQPGASLTHRQKKLSQSFALPSPVTASTPQKYSEACPTLLVEDTSEGRRCLLLASTRVVCTAVKHGC